MRTVRWLGCPISTTAPCMLSCGRKPKGCRTSGTLGGPNSVATRINASGDIVGGSDTGGGFQHAFLWTQAAGMQDIGTLPGFTHSSATDITDSGEIVGSSWSLNVKPPSGSPFFWTKSDGIKALGPFDRTPLTDADGINKAGLILVSRYTGQYGYSSYVLSPAMRATLVSSLNPAMVGQQVTLHSEVNSPVVGAPPDGEKVTITDGRTALAVVPLYKWVSYISNLKIEGWNVCTSRDIRW